MDFLVAETGLVVPLDAVIFLVGIEVVVTGFLVGLFCSATTLGCVFFIGDVVIMVDFLLVVVFAKGSLVLGTVEGMTGSLAAPSVFEFFLYIERPKT